MLMLTEMSCKGNMVKEGIKVLIAMDGNKHSDQAFQWYLQNYHKEDNDVIIVHAAEHGGLVTSPTPLADPSTACRLAKEEYEIDRFVQNLKMKLNEAGVKGDAVRISDITPGKAIVKASKQYHADLIVVGNHGHGAFRKFFKGSVNQYVLSHSNIPVMSVS